MSECNTRFHKEPRFLICEVLLSADRFRIQNELRASKQRERLVRWLRNDLRVPYLGRAAAVDEGCLTFDDAVARGADKVSFQLDGGVAARAAGKILHRAGAAHAVCEGDNASGMQRPIGREEFFA